MIEAKEILFIVLAFCALWVTLFFCWFVYQIARAIRQVNTVLSEVRDHLARLEETITGFRGRFGDGATNLGKMAVHIKHFIDGWKGSKKNGQE